jgi:hypothetical protein
VHVPAARKVTTPDVTVQILVVDEVTEVTPFPFVVTVGV